MQRPDETDDVTRPADRHTETPISPTLTDSLSPVVDAYDAQITNILQTASIGISGLASRLSGNVVWLVAIFVGTLESATIPVVLFCVGLYLIEYAFEQNKTIQPIE